MDNIGAAVTVGVGVLTLLFFLFKWLRQTNAVVLCSLLQPFTRAAMPQNILSAEELQLRARGCLLGQMVGDALGAAVEGHPQEEIRSISRRTWGTDLVQGFLEAVPMGTFCHAGEPGMYRAATGIHDSNFVPTGAPANDNVRKQCARFGMYTDDTNAALALAASIAQVGHVDAEHAARTCAEFFRDNEAFRGCPPTAKQTLQNILDGVPVDKTGLPPFFAFPGGSFANGGAMRISPLAIAYRSADAACLRSAVTAAILATHRHPEAIDFAVIVAAAVQYSLRVDPAHFDAALLLDDLIARCETKGMRSVLRATAVALKSITESCDSKTEVTKIVASEKRPGSSMSFQIASVHMAPCVFWSACRYSQDPRTAVQVAIDLGGDTDTTACMVGAIVGALHGEHWCAPWVQDLENGPHGRDFALCLADRLSRLDVR